MIINENPTFMDRLKRGDSHFNIYSGSKNYVVDKINSSTYKVVGGKGYDKASDAYLSKIYKKDSDHEVNINGLMNFIRMINRKNGYREFIQ